MRKTDESGRRSARRRPGVGDWFAHLGPVDFSRRMAGKVWDMAAWQIEARLGQGLGMSDFRALIEHPVALRRSLERYVISPWLDAAWIRTAAAGVRTDILARADAVVAHQFDLLGSGPRSLGAVIDWHRDHRSGYRWPADFWRTIDLMPGAGADIRRVWELSRCQHFPLLGQAAWLSGDGRYGETFCRHVLSWLEANPPGRGPNWACPKEAAIRAVNWIAGGLCFRDQEVPSSVWEPFFKALFEHGRFIYRHLGRSPVDGDMHAANLLGLMYLGSLFDGCREGQAWWRFAHHDLQTGIGELVHDDGGAVGGSLARHGLMTEILMAADRLAQRCSEPFPQDVRERIGRMPDVVWHLMGVEGRAPLLGDDDGSRLVRLSDYGRTWGTDLRPLFHDAGLPLPEKPPGSKAFLGSGFFVLRHGSLQATLRCGGSPAGGPPGYGHCDQLAFELFDGPYPLVLDPGTWTCTADPEGRNRFRSTAYHATVRIDGTEQSVLEGASPFVLHDRSRGECVLWEDTKTMVRFQGWHYGYSRLAEPVVHRRELWLDKRENSLIVRDWLEGDGEHRIEWFFPVPNLPYGIDGTGAYHTFAVARPNLSLAKLEGPPLGVEVLDGEVSPRYGLRLPARRLRYSLTATLPVALTFELRST